MMSNVEKVIARRNTDAFIEADEIVVQLVRTEEVPTPTGGWTKGDSVTLEPQEFRLTPTSTRASDQSFTTPDGRFIVVRQELIGHHDADMRVGDTFIHPETGLEYELVHVSPEVTHRRSAWVIQRGPHGAH